MIAIEPKRENREAFGEIETDHPGYLGSQDTYYVGNIKGVGEYNNSFITHRQPAAGNEKKSRVAWHAGLACGATREALTFLKRWLAFPRSDE